MTPSRRFGAYGVGWRRLLRHGAVHVPPWLEPIVIGWWSAFFLLWGPGRKAVMRNLKAVKPGSYAAINFFRCYRVFWNYAWTLIDTARFNELRVVPDWEFTGYEHYKALQKSGGAIVLSAHMGSYDLAAHLFSEESGLRMVVVRAPEPDPETRAYEQERKPAGVEIESNVQATDLAIDLLHAVRDGGVVAIQGDRVTGEIADMPATLFGKPTRLPAGPFALAMASRAPIHPLFIVRTGRRRYRVIALPPIAVARSRDRDAAFRQALEAWTHDLEEVVRRWWFQWFAFEPI